MSFTEEQRGGLREPWWGWGRVGAMRWSQACRSLASASQGHHWVFGLGNSWRHPPRTASGEPRLDASVIEGAIGVPGGMRDPSHLTPHYGPPGQESLQAKRIPKINLQVGGGPWRHGRKADDEVRLVARPSLPPPLQGRGRQSSRMRGSNGGRREVSPWGLPAAAPSPRQFRWHHRNQRSYKDIGREDLGELGTLVFPRNSAH